MCFTGQERESQHLRLPLCFYRRSSSSPLPPTCGRNGFDRFFFCLFLFCSDFISLWERLYFLISLHFLFVFCSDCILLQLVAVEIKAGFLFFFLGTDFISLWERLYFVVLLHFLFCVFIQIVCNNFIYERRVASMCSLMSRDWGSEEEREREGKTKEKEYFFFIQLLRYFLYQENFTVTASKKILEKFWLLQLKSPKLNKVINKVSDTRCTGVNILTDPTGPVHIRVQIGRASCRERV